MERQAERNKKDSGLVLGLGTFIALFSVLLLGACSITNDEVIRPTPPEKEVPEVDKKVEGVDFFLPKIDLGNWKVTLPIGSPSEVEPPEILDYGTNSMLKEFMYNDSTDASLVFYTYPGESTPNSSYSRTELREQLQPGSNKVNWTFAEGGKMRGRLKVEEISKDATGEFHRVIIMQIHGRLTDEQRDAIGEDDNNAPPMLKIYWAKNRVRVKTKILKDTSATGEAILPTSAWGDDEGIYFDEYVYNDPLHSKSKSRKAVWLSR